MAFIVEIYAWPVYYCACIPIAYLTWVSEICFPLYKIKVLRQILVLSSLYETKNKFKLLVSYRKGLIIYITLFILLHMERASGNS